jgi:hypothetical protein
MDDGVLPFDFPLPGDVTAPARGSSPSAMPDAGTEQADTPDRPEARPRARRRRAGFYVKFTDAGTVDWAGLEDAEQRRLRQAMAASGPVTVLSVQDCMALYGLLGQIESGIAARVAKCPLELTRQHFTFSPAECAALAEPTSKVANKYAGAFLSRYKDELVLFTTLTLIHYQKLMGFAPALRQFREEQNQPQRPSVKPNGQPQPEIR